MSRAFMHVQSEETRLSKMDFSKYIVCKNTQKYVLQICIEESYEA